MKALALFTLLIYLPTLFAQSSTITSAMAPMALYINILEGEDALNNIHDRTAREPIVQITDENHKPVKGAVVTFTEVAGATGAAGSFAGLLTYKTVTDADGKAFGRGFRTNSITGAHEVEVTAALGMLVAVLTIHEKNVAEGGVPVEPGTAAGAASAVGATAWFLGEFSAAATAVGLYLGMTNNSPNPSLSPSTASTPTTPVSVPEIDPSMAFGCLVMLAGAAAVLRGRRG